MYRHHWSLAQVPNASTLSSLACHIKRPSGLLAQSTRILHYPSCLYCLVSLVYGWCVAAVSDNSQTITTCMFTGLRARALTCTRCAASLHQASQVSGPDISQLDRHLQEQWDHAANAHLGNIVVKPFASRKVQWRCDQCPDGHPHIWLASVCSRSSGSGCPCCKGQKVCRHNCLSVRAPRVAEEWHPQLNDCTPDQITAMSNKKAHWLCPICKHVWASTIGSRTLGRGCPVCKRACGERKSHPTFAECQHPLLAEWDYERNAAQGLHPHNVRLKSQKLIFWLCSNCPAGQQHSYSARAHTRTRSSKPSGCSICAGYKACKCNSLQTLYPKLALEWDYTKNQTTPEEHTAYSRHAAWWTSAAGASWQQSINDRTIGHHVMSKTKKLRQARQQTH